MRVVLGLGPWSMLILLRRRDKIVTHTYDVKRKWTEGVPPLRRYPHSRFLHRCTPSLQNKIIEFTLNYGTIKRKMTYFCRICDKIVEINSVLKDGDLVCCVMRGFRAGLYAVTVLLCLNM